MADAIEPHPGLLGRVRQLIVAPGAAWEAIAREQPGGVFKAHVAPLALAAALASWLGAFWSAGFVLNYATLLVAPAAALLQFVLTCLGVWALTTLAEAAAQRFEAEPARAGQVVGYSATGALVGAVTLIFGGPARYFIVIGAGYSAVLLFMGLTHAAPKARRGAYFGVLLAGAVVVLIAAMVTYGAAMGGVRAAVRELGASQAGAQAPEAPAQLLARGGVLDAAALRRIGEANTWGGEPISPDALEGYLPQSLPGGFARGAYVGDATSGGAHGEAAYTRGEARMVVTIHHFGRVGAIAAVGGAREALVRRQDADGYARHQIADGRVVAEHVDGAAIAYTIIGHGVAISVSGEGGVNVDDARAAVETIGLSRLEAAFAP